MAIINNKHILFAATAALLVACGNDTVTDGSVQPTAKEEVPVTVAFADANVSTKSRAAGHDFAGGDLLIAHIRHVKKGTDDTYTEVNANLSQTRTFTVGDTPNMQRVGDTSTWQTSAITPDQKLYWDDFSSNEGENDDNDIRTDDHGLQVEWGYCFNGASNTNDPADVLNNWSIVTDQRTSYQSSDLLWAKSQEMVSYLHGSSATDNTRGGLTIPYTHAMSKATVILKAADGFDSSTGIFNNTKVQLNNMNTTGTFTASTATVTNTSTTDARNMIQMHKGEVGDDGKTATFECVFVPTELTAQKGDEKTPFIWVNSVDNNDYKIYLTQTILDSWEITTDAKSTKSGVNYQITATLNKAKVDVTAQLTDWVTKTSEGTAIISFQTDLKNVTVTDEGTVISDGTSYDIWWGKETTSLAKATTRKYTAGEGETTGTWSNDPELYWPDGLQKFYFRGLAKYDADNKITSVDGSIAATQGTDLLWATTAAHKGTNEILPGENEKTVGAGDAIDPRTSEVPMTFSHAMSKVTFVLKTTEDEASKVDLTDAKITVPSIYNEGTIAIADGKITVTEGKTGDLTTSSNTPSIVIPQDVKSKVITITLKDGTTYRYTLGESETWEGGKSYTYTVTLQKEKIDFRALIKDWTEQKGSGNATLDWD